jgi:hypothetical protein
MKNSKGIWKKAFILTLVGGLAFWLANFAISRTAIAAEYRAAMSISYYPMLLESLVGGLIIGLWVSYTLLRFFDRIPTKHPVLKSRFLPKILGMLLIADGICQFVYVCQRFIFPNLGIIAYPCLVISFIAEVSLALWLSIKAVKPQLSAKPE